MSFVRKNANGNNGRTITFEARFHRFMKPVDSRNKFEFLLDPLEVNRPESQYPKDNRLHNVDVAAEIRFLRGFCYPSYKLDENSYLTAYPPPIAMLCIPNHAMGDTKGDDVIYAIMTSCDVNYMLAFPDGTPRRANVSLTFRQIIQDPKNNSIYQTGYQEGFQYAGSWMDSKEGLPAGGGLPTNKLKSHPGGAV
jgi:hypothetical protein